MPTATRPSHRTFQGLTVPDTAIHGSSPPSDGSEAETNGPGGSGRGSGEVEEDDGEGGAFPIAGSWGAPQ